MWVFNPFHASFDNHILSMQHNVYFCHSRFGASKHCQIVNRSSGLHQVKRERERERVWESFLLIVRYDTDVIHSYLLISVSGCRPIQQIPGTIGLLSFFRNLQVIDNQRVLTQLSYKLEPRRTWWKLSTCHVMNSAMFYSPKQWKGKCVILKEVIITSIIPDKSLQGLKDNSKCNFSPFLNTVELIFIAMHIFKWKRDLFIQDSVF